MDEIRAIVKPILTGQEARAVQEHLDRNDAPLGVDDDKGMSEFDVEQRRVFYTIDIQAPGEILHAGAQMQFGRRWVTQAIYYSIDKDIFALGGSGRDAVASIALLRDHEWTATVEPEPKRVSSIAVVLALGAVVGVICLIAFVALGRRG